MPGLQASTNIVCFFRSGEGRFGGVSLLLDVASTEGSQFKACSLPGHPATRSRCMESEKAKNVEGLAARANHYTL